MGSINSYQTCLAQQVAAEAVCGEFFMATDFSSHQPVTAITDIQLAMPEN